MTFAPPDVSRVATRQIGVANAVLWIIGSIVLVIVGATSAYAFVVNPYVGGGGLLGGGGYPWEADQPLVATEASDVWSADASGVIRIPAAEFTEAHEVTVVGGSEVELYRTDPSLGLPTDDYFYPVYIGYVSAEGTRIIVPSVDDLELWVGAEGAWQLRLEPLEATVMGDGGASGTGTEYLVYTGDAVSGTFTYVGDGIFFVSIYTAYTDDIPIITTGDWSERLSWAPGNYVVFFIEANVGDGAWAIDIDELARPSPTPTETP